MGAAPAVQVRLRGSFAIHCDSPNVRTPSGRKASALLAILALSQGRVRSRRFLQDTLWSRFAHEQAQVNLRQTLREARVALGDQKDLLSTEGRNLRLGDAVRIELTSNDPDAELLEDLDGLDPAFQEWLKQQRRLHPSQSGQSSFHHKRPTLKVVDNLTDVIGAEAALLSAATLKDVRDRVAIEIHLKGDEQPDLELRLHAGGVTGDAAVAAELRSRASVLWSNLFLQNPTAGRQSNIGWLRRVANDIADAVVMCVNRIGNAGQAAAGAAEGLSAVQDMFRLSAVDLPAMETRLNRAWEETEHPVFLGWRGYAQTFVAETSGLNAHREAGEKALGFLRAALEKDPSNATTLAMSSHVHSFLLREPEAGLEFAEASLQFGASNPLGLLFMGRAKTYLGDPEEGYRLSALARSLVGFGPYKLFIDGLCGASAILAGRADEGIRLMEHLRRMAPGYKAPLRFLVPTYLLRRDISKAREVVADLKSLDENCSIEELKANLRQPSGLDAKALDFSDSDF